MSREEKPREPLVLNELVHDQISYLKLLYYVSRKEGDNGKLARKLRDEGLEGLSEEEILAIEAHLDEFQKYLDDCNDIKKFIQAGSLEEKINKSSFAETRDGKELAKPILEIVINNSEALQEIKNEGIDVGEIIVNRLDYIILDSPTMFNDIKIAIARMAKAEKKLKRLDDDINSLCNSNSQISAQELVGILEIEDSSKRTEEISKLLKRNSGLLKKVLKTDLVGGKDVRAGNLDKREEIIAMLEEVRKAKKELIDSLKGIENTRRFEKTVKSRKEKATREERAKERGKITSAFGELLAQIPEAIMNESRKKALLRTIETESINYKDLKSQINKLEIEEELKSNLIKKIEEVEEFDGIREAGVESTTTTDTTSASGTADDIENESEADRAVREGRLFRNKPFKDKRGNWVIYIMFEKKNTKCKISAESIEALEAAGYTLDTTTEFYFEKKKTKRVVDVRIPDNQPEKTEEEEAEGDGFDEMDLRKLKRHIFYDPDIDIRQFTRKELADENLCRDKLRAIIREDKNKEGKKKADILDVLTANEHFQEYIKDNKLKDEYFENPIDWNSDDIETIKTKIRTAEVKRKELTKITGTNEYIEDKLEKEEWFKGTFVLEGDELVMTVSKDGKSIKLIVDRNDEEQPTEGLGYTCSIKTYDKGDNRGKPVITKGKYIVHLEEPFPQGHKSEKDRKTEEQEEIKRFVEYIGAAGLTDFIEDIGYDPIKEEYTDTLEEVQRKVEEAERKKEEQEEIEKLQEYIDKENLGEYIEDIGYDPLKGRYTDSLAEVRRKVEEAEGERNNELVREADKERKFLEDVEENKDNFVLKYLYGYIERVYRGDDKSIKNAKADIDKLTDDERKDFAKQAYKSSS